MRKPKTVVYLLGSLLLDSKANLVAAPTGLLVPLYFYSLIG
ncbi:hypothetical protein AB4271_22330 [Vibrio splendidus]